MSRANCTTTVIAVNLSNYR